MKESTRAKWLNPVAFVTIMGVGMQMAFVQAFSTPMAAEYGGGDFLRGVIMGLSTVGAILVPTTLGYLSDRLNKKKIIMVAMVMVVIGLIITYFSSNVVMLVLGLFISGAFRSTSMSLYTGVLIDENKGRSTWAVGFSQVCLSLGGFLTSSLLVPVADKLGGWRMLYLASSILYLLLFAATWMLPFGRKKVQPAPAADAVEAETQPAPAEQKKWSFIKLITQPMIIAILLSIFLYYGIEVSTMYWVENYFIEVLDAKTIGRVVASAIWAGMILGRLVCSRFGEKKFRTLRILTTGMLVALIVAVFIPWAIPKAVCFVLLAFFMGGVWPTLVSVAGVCYPTATGATTGMIMTLTSVGNTCFSLIDGSIAEKAGAAPIFYILIAVAVGLCLLHMLMRVIAKKVNGFEQPL